MKILNTSELQKDYQSFAFDGCHKIYLTESSRQEHEAEDMGYKILPIHKLARTFENSCPLRFISDWNLTTQIVKQGEDVEIM